MSEHKIYGLINARTGKYIFSYQTNQGNVKKAFFNSEKLAQTAIDRYIQRKYKDKIVLAMVGNYE